MKGFQLNPNGSVQTALWLMHQANRVGAKLIRWQLVEPTTYAGDVLDHYKNWTLREYEAWHFQQIVILRETILKMRQEGLKQKIIVDMHSPYGWTRKSFFFGKDVHRCLVDKHYRREFFRLWKVLVYEFLDFPEIIGWDLLNEPAAKNRRWFNVATKLIKIIRLIDPQRTIYMPVVRGSIKDWNRYEPLPFKNIIYQEHCYWPNGISFYLLDKKYTEVRFFEDLKLLTKAEIENYLKPLRKFQINFNVPIYIGEIGCTRNVPPHTRNLFFKLWDEVLTTYKWDYTIHAVGDHPTFDVVNTEVLETVKEAFRKQ